VLLSRDHPHEQYVAICKLTRGSVGHCSAEYAVINAAGYKL